LIDCHTHIGHLPGAINDVYTAEDLIYICEQEGVKFMLVSSASATTISQSYATAEAIAMVESYGERLGGMLWVNPHHPAWRSDVERAAQHGFYGLKIHPVLDHYAVDRAALEEVFASAREHGWPILTHTDVDGSPGSAARYEPLVKAYPDVILILAHLRLEAMLLAKRYENVYLDTTYVTPEMVEIGVDVVGADKILFGSDAAEGFDVGRLPGRSRPRRCYLDLIQGIRNRGISDADLQKITCLNARSVFDIPGSPRVQPPRG
jgi:predicted TIM-barrel fold metal-dependent hydrolase